MKPSSVSWKRAAEEGPREGSIKARHRIPMGRAKLSGRSLVSLGAALLVIPGIFLAIHFTAGKHKTGWILTLADNFDLPSSLKQWNFSVGGNGWSLKQLQWYDKANATVDQNGQLVITASKGGDGNSCWYGPCQYTSTRMSTLGTFSQAYGKFEARIKIPVGQGLWPAFWIEGANVFQVGWPASGEVDIIEKIGQFPYLVQGYAHAPNFQHSGFKKLREPLAAGYHVYGITWTPTGVTWTVDGVAYSHMKAYPGWPFNHPFYIILDLAVGGTWPGTPSPKTHFPAKMYVDWVHVYHYVS
jgi:beta-glucanase (GH16 family)